MSFHHPKRSRISRPLSAHRPRRPPPRPRCCCHGLYQRIQRKGPWSWKINCLENLVYHFFRQQWLVLGVKLMEINSNLFSRWSDTQWNDQFCFVAFSHCRKKHGHFCPTSKVEIPLESLRFMCPVDALFWETNPLKPYEEPLKWGEVG